jgi:hypothetical protein
MRTNDDMRRELEKITDAVDAAVRHFRAQAEADAALHMATVVRPNPLTVAVEAAAHDLHRLINELEATDG